MAEQEHRQWSELLPETAARYERCSKLGNGGQGNVYLVTDRVTGTRYAAKVFPSSNEWGLERESEMMRRLRFCPGVVAVERVLRERKGGGAVIMQLCGRSLFDKLCRSGPLCERDAAAVVLKLATTIKAIHSRRVVHRDLKLENVFEQLDAKEPGDVVIGDFGLATHDRSELAQYCGTASFMAPEVAVLHDRRRGQTQEQTEITEHYTSAVDSWGLGVIAYELLHGRLSEGELQEVRAGRMPTGISKDAATLIHGLLELQPRKRLSMAKVIQHPWIKKMCGGVSATVTTTTMHCRPSSKKRKATDSALEPLPKQKKKTANQGAAI